MTPLLRPQRSHGALVSNLLLLLLLALGIIGPTVSTVGAFVSPPPPPPPFATTSHTTRTRETTTTRRGGPYNKARHVSTTTAMFSTSSTTQKEETRTTVPWTRQQLQDFCAQQGIVLSLTTLGPGYRAVARYTPPPTTTAENDKEDDKDRLDDDDDDEKSEDDDTTNNNNSILLGYIEGFVRPTGSLLHLDKMEVFAKQVTLARNLSAQQKDDNGPRFQGGGTILGVGLLLGYLCLLHGQENNCQKAEFLAIDDEAFQHKRLVRYYTTSGFEVIKYVGDDWQSIPDRLIWGGCGTLLRKDIDSLLVKWTRLMERSVRSKQKRQQQNNNPSSSS